MSKGLQEHETLRFSQEYLTKGYMCFIAYHCPEMESPASRDCLMDFVILRWRFKHGRKQKASEWTYRYDTYIILLRSSE